eukprot:gene44365-55174_t
MIELKNVSKWYGPVQVLNECTATIQKGEVVVVCGPSGSGKSTLIKTINALEPFQKGEISVDGVKLHDPSTNLPKLRSRVGMVFQHFELFPHLSVTDNLTIAQIKVLGRSADDAKKRGLKMLERVGLALVAAALVNAAGATLALAFSANSWMGRGGPVLFALLIGIPFIIAVGVTGMMAYKQGLMGILSRLLETQAPALGSLGAKFLEKFLTKINYQPGGPVIEPAPDVTMLELLMAL